MASHKMLSDKPAKHPANHPANTPIRRLNLQDSKKRPLADRELMLFRGKKSFSQKIKDATRGSLRVPDFAGADDI
jgi:hypothetical protein